MSSFNFDVITLFPKAFQLINNLGVITRALDKNLIDVNLHDLREYGEGAYRQVDDKPYGGGEGMVLMAAPLENAIKNIPSDNLGIVINLSPQGTIFSQKKAKELSKLKNITIICGRYEGIDERLISQYVDDEISIGDYVLSGGEFAALTLIDTLSRFIPGVIGNKKSVELDSFSQGLLKGPVFTRPETFNSNDVPEVLISGDHNKIKEWRDNQSLIRTFERRPDLLKNAKLTKKQKKLLEELSSKAIL